MNLTLYQLMTPAVSLVAIIYAWNLFYHTKKTIWEACLWTIFWTAVAVIALFPDAITYLSVFTGIHDRENAVLVTFLAILFLLVFYLIIRLEELERRLTRVIRKVALSKTDLKSEATDKHNDR